MKLFLFLSEREKNENNAFGTPKLCLLHILTHGNCLMRSLIKKPAEQQVHNNPRLNAELTNGC